MKVLNISGSFDKGGLESLIMNVIRCNANGDDKMQIDVLCIDVQSGYYETEARVLGTNVFYLPPTKPGKLNKLPFSLFQKKKSIKEFLKNHKYDVVHIHISHAFFYVLVKYVLSSGVKNVIVHSHNAGVEWQVRLHTFFSIKLRKAPIIRLTCSELAGKFMFAGANDVINVFNGIETEKFRFNKELRCELRKKYKITDDYIVIGHVGRFVEVKNHKFLLYVFKELLNSSNKEYFLFLIGHGQMKQEIMELSISLGINDKIIFEDENAPVNELLNVFDVFVLPSLSEGLPVVLVEAQVNGLPCLLADTISKQAALSNNAEHVPLDAVAWVSKLIEYSTRQRNTLDNIQQYDIEATVELLKEIYNNPEKYKKANNGKDRKVKN